MTDSLIQVRHQAGMLANRVRKNSRHRRKWARRESVTCYRLYDRDIPEVPIAVDLYQDHLHIAEYARGGTDAHDPSVMEIWADAVAEVLGIPREQVFIKSRRRQRGKEQYGAQDRSGHHLVVEEGGLKFIVNLQDYLDTGLFLDHRRTRQLIRSQADGCHILNLFAYTGSFTVYAADGGALSTTTVDLSKTYLAWSRRNLELNELADSCHELIHADAITWCGDAARNSKRYDIIILDPPTFSNSKRSTTVFDIQRDHTSLICDALELLTPGGVVYFSTNSRRFRMDDSLGEWARLTEITSQTAPPDFTRAPHRCWRLELR